MRSGLTACLVTVGVVLMASDKAEALSLTAADFACYQNGGPCRSANGGSDQDPRTQLWEWYEAVSRDGGSAGPQGIGSNNGSSNLRNGGANGALRNDRLETFGREIGDQATDIAIVFVVGPAFHCTACFLQPNGSASNQTNNGSGGNSNQYLFNQGGWSGTDAFQASGFYTTGQSPNLPPPGSENFAPTPEPGTMGLVMVGLALLAGPLRRLLRERKSLDSSNR